MNRTGRFLPICSLALPALLVGCSDSSDYRGATTPPGPSCTAVAPEALRSCIGEVSSAVRSCYSDGDGPCDDNNPDIEAALAGMQGSVAEACADGELFSLSLVALVGRLENACRSQADSIAWRTFGGPQGAVWPGADGDGSSRAMLPPAAPKSSESRPVKRISLRLWDFKSRWLISYRAEVLVSSSVVSWIDHSLRMAPVARANTAS